MSKVFEVAFKLGGELTSSFKNAIEQANKSFKGLEASGAALQSVGKTLSMSVTAPVVAMGTASVAAAIDFESAFAGVKKTIDSTDEGYAKLESGIREMAKTLPATASEIAAVAESAGQLGIAEDNILKFSRTIVDLGESTNMTREQAATEFARFANIVGMSQDNFDRLGSSIVGLGNTMATTESEIMSMGMRLAGQGAQVGMAESEIMALSATMSSLGIGAESGGTAMTTILKKIQTATGNGGKELKAFAKVAGMSSKEFKTAFETNAVGALDSLVKGLAASGAEGENLTGVLSTLGIKGIYESDVLLRMSGASDLLSSALETAGTSWEENTALANEAEQRYATTASQLAILKNKVVDVAITIGGILIPIVLEIADKVGVWVDKFASLDEGTMKTIMILAGLAAAVGPVLVVMGTLINSIVTVGRAYKSASLFIKSFNIIQKISTSLLYAHRTAMLAYTFAGGGMAGVMAALKSGLAALNLAFLTSPIFLVVAGLIALGAAFYIAYKRSDRFREIVNGAFESVKTTVLNTASFIANYASNMWNGIVLSAKELPARIQNAISQSTIGKMLSGLFSGEGIVGGLIDSIKVGFSSLPNILSLIAPSIATVGLAFLGVSGPIGLLIGGVISVIGFLYRLSQTNEGVASALASAWSAVKTAFEPVIKVLSDGIAEFAEGVGPQLSETMTVISESISEMAPLFAELGGTLAEVATLFIGAWSTVGTTMTTKVLPLLLEVFQLVFTSILSIVTTVVPILVGVLLTVIPVILNVAQVVLPILIQVFSIVAGIILNVAQTVLPILLTVVQMVFPMVLSIIQMVIPIIATVLQTLVTVLNTVVIPAINLLLSVVQIVFPYIQMVIQNALALINGILQAAMSLLQGDWDGAWNAIKTTAETIMNNIISFFQGINLFEVGKSIINGLIDGIASMGSAVMSAIGGLVPEPLKGAASKLLGALPGFAEGGVVSAPTLAWIGEGGDTESVIPWNNSQRSKDLWIQTGQQLGMLNDTGALDATQQPSTIVQQPNFAPAIEAHSNVYNEVQHQMNAPKLPVIEVREIPEIIHNFEPVQQQISVLHETGALENAQQQIDMQKQANDKPAITTEQLSNSTNNNQNNSTVIHLNYGPQYNVQNPEDLERVKKHADQDKDDLAERIEELQRNKRRKDFG